MNKITLSHLYLLRIQTTLCKKLALNSPDSTKFPCTRSFIHVCLRYERFSHYVPPSKIKFKIFLKFLSVSACINRWGVYQLVFGKNVFSLFSTFLDQIQENFFFFKIPLHICMYKQMGSVPIGFLEECFLTIPQLPSH